MQLHLICCTVLLKNSTCCESAALFLISYIKKNTQIEQKMCINVLKHNLQQHV